MLDNDTCQTAFEWIMLGRPATVDGLRDALPTLALLGMRPVRNDCITLPNGQVIDVIAASCYDPPHTVTAR